MLHYNFINKTDKRNLHNQIKSYVSLAQEVIEDNIEVRRAKLQKLLDYDDKIFEQEFTLKVKMHTEEDIRDRYKVLHSIKEQNERVALEFLRKKEIQHDMESCYEVRQALRAKELRNMKICQMEQIADNERKERRNRDLESYWINVDRVNRARTDATQRKEDCLKQQLAQRNKQILDVQMLEACDKREEERKVRLEEIAATNKHVEELRLEEFDARNQKLPRKTLEYRNDLMQMMNEKKTSERREEQERADEHRRLMEELQRVEREDNAAALKRKHALKVATLDYIAYLKRMRQLEESQERMRDDRTDDLRRVDLCTKSSKQKEANRKAEIAARCFAELRLQVHEQCERRLREEAERKEPKMLENRFGRDGISRAQILENRRQHRAALDRQVAELHRIRAEEEEKYKQDLRLATDDPELCRQLTEKYMSENMDYLEPHANWRILACPVKKYVPKPPQAGGDAQRVCGNTGPCGCHVRHKTKCEF